MRRILQSLGRGLWRETVMKEGSTRSLAIIRIGLMGLLWDRWASEFLLYKADSRLELLIGASYFVSTTMVLFGIWTRFSTIWAALTMLGVFYGLGVYGGIESYTHHHTWLLASSTVLLAFTPCGASYSWDRWRALVKAEKAGVAPPPERGPLWGQFLLAFQVCMVYIWGAYDKTSVAFLSGQRMEHHFLTLYGTSDYPDWSLFPIVCQVLAVSTVLLEYALGFLLWIPYLQPVLIPVGMIFHGILFYTLPVGPFSATMWLLYLAFVPTEAVHRWLDRVSGLGGREQVSTGG